MGGLDILKALREKDGLDRNALFERVSHLVNKKSFDKNLRSLLNASEIFKIERIKFIEGSRTIIVRFFLM